MNDSVIVASLNAVMSCQNAAHGTLRDLLQVSLDQPSILTPYMSDFA